MNGKWLCLLGIVAATVGLEQVQRADLGAKTASLVAPPSRDG